MITKNVLRMAPTGGGEVDRGPGGGEAKRSLVAVTGAKKFAGRVRRRSLATRDKRLAVSKRCWISQNRFTQERSDSAEEGKSRSTSEKARRSREKS